MCEEELCHTYFLYRYTLHVDQWSRVFQAHPDPHVDAAIKENMKKGVSVMKEHNINSDMLM